jgi:serine/threonine-protein kinase
MTADLRSRLQTALGSAYTVERELAGGGMSQVFVAMESRLGRRVVVKVLRQEIAAGTSAERFEREMAYCARCTHPHIVPLLTTGEIGGIPYFTMPLVEGESLRERLARSGRIPIPETVRLLGEIADALAYAHRQGVIHRDIKPENILFQGGHALVADFGVAKALHLATTDGGSEPQTTSVGMVIGTPAYMSPEQAMADPALDHRADLYALGVVGYEMVTGRPPFTGGSAQALLSAHMTTAPAPPSRFAPECPEALATLIERLLAKEPSRRPQTAEEVVSTLQGIAERPSGGRSRRTRALGAGIAVAGIAVLYGLGLFRASPPSGAGPVAATGVPSIAVLPFDNIGGDSTTNYFSDGMSEELINALGKLEGLRVASRTSAFAARRQSDDLRDIGTRLSVAAVLEGSVRRDGPRVRVTARLVDVARDSQLWVGEYESRLENVFAVQDTIARAIAGALKVTLSGGRGEALVARGTTDPEAHDLYLRGRHFLAVRNPVGLRRAIDAFQAALARDSNYALAYAGLADGYSLGVPFGGFLPSAALPAAKTAARRALSLDSTLAEARISLGIIAMFNDWDWAEAERQFLRAIRLNPSSAQAHLFYAWYLLLTGKSEPALAELERARELDPLSLIINTRRGSFLHYLGRDVEAIPAFQRALELDSTFAFAKAGLALSYAILGRFEEALAQKPQFDAGLGSFEVGQLVVTQALAGRPEEARRILKGLEDDRKRRYIDATAFAAGHAALGETETAFAELDRAVRERSFTLVTSVSVEPMFASLHADPRWARLRARLNLP